MTDIKGLKKMHGALYKQKALEKLFSLVRYILLVGLCFIIVYPFIIKLTTVFMSQEDLADDTVFYLSRNPTFENIKNVIEKTGYWQALKNTALISLMTAVLQTGICTYIGYGFAHFNFRGKNLVFALVIFTLLIPPQALSVSYYMEFLEFDIAGLFKLITGRTAALTDSPLPLILLSLTGLGFKNGLYIFLMRQFFAGVPKELGEAADVDGAGVMTTFFRVILPQAKPMMTTVFLFSFAWQWTDDYYTPLFFLNTNLLNKVISQAGSISFGGTPVTVGTKFSGILLNTAAILVILPLLIVFLFAQKKFVQGIESSGIVG